MGIRRTGKESSLGAQSLFLVHNEKPEARGKRVGGVAVAGENTKVLVTAIESGSVAGGVPIVARSSVKQWLSSSAWKSTLKLSETLREGGRRVTEKPKSNAGELGVFLKKQLSDVFAEV